MKLTRRRLARMLAISAALPAGVSAQVPARGSTSDAAPLADAEVSAARDEFREAARSLAAVKLPRSAEPATRFEA
jgi:hypothetical protein